MLPFIVFSDVFGKSSSNIVGYILDNPNEKLADVSRLAEIRAIL